MSMPCICQRHRRGDGNSLAQLIRRPQGLQSEDVLADVLELHDPVARGLQASPHPVQPPQQLLVPVGEDQGRPGDLDAVHEGAGRQVRVDEGRGGADGQQAEPGAHEVRGVGHVEDDEAAGPDARGEEPLGVLVGAGVGLAVGQGGVVGPEGLGVAILPGGVLEEVVE